MLVSLLNICPSVVMLEINNKIKNPFQQNISTIVCLNHACCFITDIITCKDQRQIFFLQIVYKRIFTLICTKGIKNVHTPVYKIRFCPQAIKLYNTDLRFK